MCKDIKCPYCGKEQNIDHDDGYGYEEGVTRQQQCRGCGKNFVYTTHISFDYEASKADCLNDGEHEWKMLPTWPRNCTLMECMHCGETRRLTKEECEIYKINKIKKGIKWN